MKHDQSSYFCRGPDDFCWGPAPVGPILVTGPTDVLGRQLSQERSKPNPIDYVQTAHYIGVHMICTIMMRNSTELVK